jgi:ubiquinone/menaquinone biosynthesis C-methylase UbiE
LAIPQINHFCASRKARPFVKRLLDNLFLPAIKNLSLKEFRLKRKMTIDQAISLISTADINQDSPQRWADLGCGSGLFSRALASIRPPESHILCMDKDDQTIDRINKVTVEFKRADFSMFDFGMAAYNGFLLANSLHYIKNKAELLNNLMRALKNGGSLVIIEYDTTISNPWIPYPASFETLRTLFDKPGIEFRKLSQMPSVYGRTMVAIQAKKTGGEKI